MTGSEWWQKWSPQNVTLADNTTSNAWKTCVIQGVYFGQPEYNGQLGARISSIFVIFATSLIATATPLLAKKYKLPETWFTVTKMFGSGIIVATAFIHLMDPAYNAIGPTSCVGMTGAWASYSWCAAFIMLGAFFTFLIDVYCDALMISRSQKTRSVIDVENRLNCVTSKESPSSSSFEARSELGTESSVRADDRESAAVVNEEQSLREVVPVHVGERQTHEKQIYGFLILEFGIVLHSVMIGLTLGTTGDLGPLYAAIALHQLFEGLGLGARLSAIPFSKWWHPYSLCVAYAIATPLAIAIGIGVRTRYREKSYESLVVSGVLDSFAAGVLIYTGFVELIARDFIFPPTKPRLWELNLQVGSLLLGAAVMAVIGKWA